MALGSRFREALAVSRRVLDMYSDVRAIARRMFVTNSFDGLLASIGVMIGGFSEEADPLLLGLSVVGGGVAMGVLSGVVGVYMSERAERMRELQMIEKKVAKSLKGTMYDYAARIVPIYVALWSGMGIILFPVIVSLPFFASSRGLISPFHALIAGLGLAYLIMVSLGAYLGRVSGESVLGYSLRGLALAIGGSLVALAIKIFFGGVVLG